MLLSVHPNKVEWQYFLQNASSGKLISTWELCHSWFVLERFIFKIQIWEWYKYIKQEAEQTPIHKGMSSFSYSIC